MKILWLSGVLMFFGLVICAATFFTDFESLSFYWEGVFLASLILTVVFSMLPVIKNCKNWKSDVMKVSYILTIVAHVILAAFIFFVATEDFGSGSLSFVIVVIVVPAEIIVYLISIIMGYFALRSEYKNQLQNS